MKTRHGFVSNSSSASFVLDGRNETVFDLARRMIIECDSGVWGPQNELDRKELDRLVSSGMDPNTPLCFNTCNYRTYIRKLFDCLCVATCNNHEWELDNEVKIDAPDDLFVVLAGPRTVDKDEAVEYEMKHNHIWWFLDYGVFGIPSRTYDYCETHCNDFIMITSGALRGKIGCPLCLGLAS